MFVRSRMGGSRNPPGARQADPFAWHAATVDQVLERLGTSTSGLSETEAEERRARCGPNRLPAAAQPSALRRLLRQFHNLLIYVLIAAAVLSALLGHGVDSLIILAVVIVNAVIGFVQEGRAEQALEAIRSMIDPQASVVRNGRRTTVAADQIVPGDVVWIEAGDRVPADLRLTRARNLRLDEAILTGESVAVEKRVELVTADAALGDRVCMGFSGTYVAAGQGLGVAVATGESTELGHVSSLIAEVATLKTPLIERMDRFALHLTLVILAAAALAFLFAWLARDYAVGDAFMIVVGLAVAAIPEGLPAIMTITLAIGVQRMASRHAIIRRLPAVETLGSVSVICSDKTGTLTRNEMTVRRLSTPSDEFVVTGVGYTPKGSIRAGERDVDPARQSPLTELIRGAMLCNDAELRPAGEDWRVDGDPMEGALIALGMKAGCDAAQLRREYPRTDEIPFDAAHRFMASLHHDHRGAGFIFIKGAPERVIDMCQYQRDPAGDRALDQRAWHRRADELAAEGHRVLALAVKPFDPSRSALTFADVAGGATLLGLIGLIDPPRAEAIEAVRDCASAGIRVVMIAGDHAVTAGEIARQLGLAERPNVLTGGDLHELDDTRLAAVVRDTSVFARTTPEHKLRLVQALQANGLTVAMTGDGVNDAPALKRADVGVAMGRKGTEVAKQAAEMVLADDNFASIVAAVREGRTVYDNLLKVIAWTLPTNGGEALTILAAIGFGLVLPITPAQILWINMITAVALGLTLAFEPTEPGTMRRAPRARHEPILSGPLLWRIAFVSVLFVAGAFGMFYWAESRGLAHEVARTAVVNTIVVMEIFYLFSVRYTHGTSLTWTGVLGTRAVLIGVGVVVIAQFAFTYLPVMHSVFQSRPLGLLDGAAIIGVGVLLLLIVETEKRLRAFVRPRVGAPASPSDAGARDVDPPRGVS